MPNTTCLKCGRPLTDPRSIDHSMGPICYRAVCDDMSERTHSSDVCDLPFDEESRDIVCKRVPRPCHECHQMFVPLEGCQSCGGTGDGFVCHFNFAQVIVRHSPAGMEWGYAGSGPADFAINALLAVTGDRLLCRHPLIYKTFCQLFVATLPHEGGTIKGDDVRAWMSKMNAAGLDVCRQEVAEELRRESARRNREALRNRARRSRDDRSSSFAY